MLAVRTPGAPLTARVVAARGSAFPFERQGRLLRSRSISGLFSRSLHSGLQPPCLRFATAVTGRHARLGSRLLARLCRGRHRRRQTSTRLQGATRSNPCRRNSRTRLLPWVHDGETLVRIRVKDTWLREPVGGEPVHSLPREAVLLATPPQRAQPDALHIIVECSQCRAVSRHSMIGEEASDHPLEPGPLLGDWFIHAPSQFLLDPPERCPHAI